MKVEKVIEILQELPPDYEMCFSDYTAIVCDEDGEKEEYFVVLDMPIVGILRNDDTKEVRLFTQSSEERVIKEIEDGKEWKELE
jgi:hypothetical protein